MIRLVATDLDGTLLHSTYDISAYTVDVLRSVQDAGARIVPVTARAPRSTQPIAEQFGISGYAICGSGSLLYDLDRSELLLARPLDASISTRLVKTLRSLTPGVLFAAEREMVFTREPGFEVPIPAMHISEADGLEIVAGPVTKLIARHTTMELELLVETIAREAGDEAEVGLTGGNWVEIRAVGASKAEMLQDLCARLGIEAGEVVAFGDLPVDIPMLAWAGLGVAPANAHDDVLRVADEVTKSNDEDGVATTLERLLSEGRIRA